MAERQQQEFHSHERRHLSLGGLSSFSIPSSRDRTTTAATLRRDRSNVAETREPHAQMARSFGAVVRRQPSSKCKSRRGTGAAGVRLAPLVMFSLALVLTLAIRSAESFFIDEKQSGHASEWNYHDQARWGELHRDCSGRAQSPIDIQHRNVITSQHLRLHFYNYNQQTRFKLSNAHHTIKMNPLGSGYESESGGGPPPPLNANTSSFHDILTADEYLEITPAHQAASGAGGSPANNDNEHLSKLVLASSGGGAHNANAGQQQAVKKDQRDGATTRNKSQHQMTNEIERERELEHGNTNSLHHIDASRAHAKRLPYEGAPTIKLDWLDDGNNEYKLRDVHFHWGERRDNGSEHAIDGRRAAMEMHLVHIKHGLDKSSIGFTSDSVAVIAVLIESHRKSNADFNPIVNELARINSTEQAQEIDYKSIYDLLPSNLQAFYTYSGSLTTPPCYQVVNWIVMAERLNMNAKQIEIFRNLYAPAKHEGDNEAVAAAPDELEGNEEHENHKQHQQVEPIMPNVRHIQSLNNRTILASFTKYGSRLEAVTSTFSAAESLHQSEILLVQCVLLSSTFGFALLQLFRPGTLEV